jgi:hypothetical protein
MYVSSIEKEDVFSPYISLENYVYIMRKVYSVCLNTGRWSGTFMA